MTKNELIQDLTEQLTSVQKRINELKTKYFNEVLTDYDSYQIKYTIGLYEGQEMILVQVLEDLKYLRA